jgi:hypothetical protein
MHEGGFCIAETYSQQHHRHVGCKHDVLRKRMTFISSVTGMYTLVFIYSNGCVTFASLVSSGVCSMKRMTFVLSVLSHVYADLNLYEQLCCLRLVGTQRCSIPL